MARIKKQLLERHYTNVTYYGWAGKLWQRLSCPVYVDPDEIKSHAAQVSAAAAEISFLAQLAVSLCDGVLLRD